MTHFVKDKVLVYPELAAELGANMLEKVEFSAGDVPENLRALIPYAQVWGISDDWQRGDAVKATPQHLRENLKLVVSKYDDQLDEWLAGPESANTSPTDAYIAFSAMRMAADTIRV